MNLKAYKLGHKVEILFEPAQFSTIRELVLDNKGKPFPGFEVDYMDWSKPISLYVEYKELDAFLELTNIRLQF